MATDQQMLDNAVDDQPAMSKEEDSAVRENTCIVLKWHLTQTPAERKVEAERRAILDAEEAAALRVRFKVTPAELEKSETEWKDWVSKRSRDFVSSWRDSIPASTADQGGTEPVNATCFGKVVNVHHDECILCEAMEATRTDPELPHGTMLQRLRRLEHTIRKLQMSTVEEGTIAAGTRNEPTFEDLVNASTWKHESASSIEKPAAVAEKRLFNGISFRPEKLEATIDIQEGQWKISRSITKALKPFEEYSKAVKQRVNLYKYNKETARFALQNRLDHESVEKAAKAKADAVELERDLAMLQSTLNATRARLEHVKNGNGRSVLEFNKTFCQMRRYKWDAGLHMEKEGIRYRPAVPDPAVKEGNSPFEEIWKMRDIYQEQRSLRGSPPPPGEDLSESSTPPTQSISSEPHDRRSRRSKKPAMVTRPTETRVAEGATTTAVNESTKTQFDGQNPFAKTLQEVNEHTCEQEDTGYTSTESSTFVLEDALNAVSNTNEAAESSLEVVTAASAKGKGKAKKDSKVDGLLEQDGISLKDFAPEVEQNKGRPLRKLSVKAGSSSRSLTDSSFRPAWKP